MKQQFFIFIVVLNFIFLTSVFSDENKPFIQVRGTAAIYLPPDSAEVLFGVETIDTDLKKAKAINDAIIIKAISAIKALKVQDKDIQTDFISIRPTQKQEDWEIDDDSPATNKAKQTKRKEITSYKVENSFKVKIDDISKVDAIISTVLLSGINNVKSVRYLVKEPQKHRIEAKIMALKAAKTKAEEMVKALGCSLGRPLEINEQGATCDGNTNCGFAEQEFDSSSLNRTIMPGNIEICERVIVNFQLIY